MFGKWLDGGGDMILRKSSSPGLTETPLGLGMQGLGVGLHHKYFPYPYCVVPCTGVSCSSRLPSPMILNHDFK